MFKAVIMLTRRADMSHEEFTRWWLDEHVPLASALMVVTGLMIAVTLAVGTATLERRAGSPRA